MRGAALLLGVCLLAAGCTPAPAEKSIKEKEEARGAELARLKGWDRLFAAPDSAIGAANQFGFHAPAWAGEGKTWGSKGGPVTIAGSMSKTPNQVTFVAQGPSATEIDRIGFSLTTADPETAKDAGKRFARLVRDYLFQAGIEGDALIPAIEQGVPARGTLAGTAYAIERWTGQEGAPITIVTFTRTGAQAPATSKPQGS